MVVVSDDMDHGSRLKTRSQTPSRTPAKGLPSKQINSSSKSQNPTMSSSSSSSMLTPVQKESVRSVSAGPRERPVNTPLVALLPSGVLTAQKGGRSKTPNRLQGSSMSYSASVSSLKKLCSTAAPTPAAQAPGSTQALSSSVDQHARQTAEPVQQLFFPLSSSLSKGSKLPSPLPISSTCNNAKTPSKSNGRPAGCAPPISPAALLTPVVVPKPRSVTTTLTKSNSRCSQVSPAVSSGDGEQQQQQQRRRRQSSSELPSVSGSYPVPRKTAMQEFHEQRKLRISGYGRNPCLVKASCIVPEGQLLPHVSPPTFSAKKRCGWITSQSDEAYIAYHDEEWGVPVHDDKLLFELLVLEGAQAEMSRPRILSLRENFRARFEDFDPAVVAKYDEEKIAALKSDSSICSPESKVRGAVENAKRILEVVDEYGSFSSFLWGFVNNKPTVSHYKLQKQVPVKTPKSEALSKELVRRGFQFVGPTVMCSVMQAAGLVNDHLVCCFRHQECSDLAGIKDSRKGSDTQTQMYRQHSSQPVNNRPSQDPTSWVDACNFPYLPGFPSPFELTPSFSFTRLPIIDETWERETNTDEEEHGFI
jgi:DNA-3-methyladenine glycosylase I